MKLKNNREIIENTTTTVYFLVADPKIQDSAQPKKQNLQWGL